MDYKEYSKEVRNYMSAAEKYLVKRYGEISKEWEITLTLLADNLELYLQCRDAILKNGIYDTKTGKKSPLLSTMKDLNATLMKNTQKLGITPYDSAKIKVVETDDSDLLATLIGED